MYGKYKDKILYILAAILVTFLYYFLAQFMAAYQTAFNLRYLGALFLVACVWVYFGYTYRKYIRNVFCLGVLFTLLGFIVPLIGCATSPIVFRTVMRDLLFSITLPLCILAVPLITSSTTVRKICLYVFMPVAGIFILIPLIILAYYYAMHARIKTDAIVAVLETNLQETLEFFAGYFSVIEGFIFIILFSTVLIIIYVLLKNIFADFQTEISGRKAAVLFLLLCLGCGKFFAGTYAVNTFKGAIAVFEDTKAFKAYRMSKLQECTHGHEGNESFALVIGESQARSHMSAYGYKRNTTPWLKTQNNNGNVILLKNGFSCAALTELALEMALTEKSQYNTIPLKEAMTIIEMARHAGFRTVWISNQDTGINQNTGNVAALIALQADEAVFLNKDRAIHRYWMTKDVFDKAVIDELKKIKKQPQKTLYVIHLIGSHQLYKCRYPEEFAVWDESKDRINTYDNSLLYNDYVMAEIQKMLFKTLDVDGMVYFADHGEELKKYFHHGTEFFLSNYKTVPSVRDVVKIPVYMCFSKRYKKAHLGAVKNLERNSKKYFSNDMIYDTMLGLMGIKCQHYNPAQDISAGKYNFGKNTLRTMYGEVKITEIN